MTVMPKEVTWMAPFLPLLAAVKLVAIQWASLHGN
jgi:hypothetical protein